MSKSAGEGQPSQWTVCKCNACDGHLEFDASHTGETVECPHCGLETRLYIPQKPAGPPKLPVAMPLPHAGTVRANRSAKGAWIVGLASAAIGLIVFASVALLKNYKDVADTANPTPHDYPIYPERIVDDGEKPLVGLDHTALDVAISEMNRLLYKTNEFIFANIVRPKNSGSYWTFAVDRYIQAKHVKYRFRSANLTEADTMNGFEFRGAVMFIIDGAAREYEPGIGRGWSEWRTYPWQDEAHYATLHLNVEKKRGSDWETKQITDIIFETFRPVSREKVGELLRLPQGSAR